ncbi:MAG: formyltetrahydrofolate deformylase [Candidatus Omnitrophica bacterium]|nr:formyltetrahydrofolate deformylase [Candidatus Omnitrophota bacterium]
MMYNYSMNTFVLLFTCRDKRGIVSRTSDFILAHEGNIIAADQYSTDPEGGKFFLRIEFFIKDDAVDKEALSEAFSAIAKEFNGEYNIYSKDEKMKMGIMVSRPDHCLVELLYLWESKEINVDIPFVVSNYPEHKKLVERYDIPFYYMTSDSSSRKEKEILNIIRDSDFLVLARYMLVLSGSFIDSYEKDIINIHHSFLPSFKGADPYGKAFKRGVKVIGATAHFVTEKLDEGPIITQMVEHVSHKDSESDLKRKGKHMEKRALAQAVYEYINHRIIKDGNRTIVF